jgi:hypothetical protein
VRSDVQIDEAGIESGFRAVGVGEARGGALRNPVTGEDHRVAIVLERGFIWARGAVAGRVSGSPAGVVKCPSTAPDPCTAPDPRLVRAARGRHGMSHAVVGGVRRGGWARGVLGPVPARPAAARRPGAAPVV